MKECNHGGNLYSVLGSNFSNLKSMNLIYPADVLDAWFPPSPNVVKVLEDNSFWTHRTSPPPSNQNMIDLISDEYNISSKLITVGHGSSDLIYRVLPSLVDKRGAVIIKPAYGEYEHVINNILGYNCFSFYTENNNFKFTANDMARFIEQKKAGAIILINPCNPTGEIYNKADVLELLNMIPKNVSLIIDETYSEYNNREQSLMHLVSDYSNLFIFKSLSKTYALSGLRAGFCVLNEKMSYSHQQKTPPYTIPTPTQLALFETFRSKKYYRDMIEVTIENLKYFIKTLNENIPDLGIINSSINCVLLDLKNLNGNADDLLKFLSSKKIFIRNIDNQGIKETGRYVRVSILDKKSMSVIAKEISHWYKQL